MFQTFWKRYDKTKCRRKTYGDPFKAGDVEGFNEESFPEGVSVLEVDDGLVLPEVAYPVSHMLDGESHSPDTVIGVAMEAGVLRTAAGVVFLLVLPSRLEHEM